MDGAIFMLCRQVHGDQGQKFSQTVSVFAENPTQARAIVAREFDWIRRNSRSEERPYGRAPAWKVEKLQLDEHRVLGATITT